MTIRLEPELLARIDAEAKRVGGTRTSWVLAMIEAGLTRPKVARAGESTESAFASDGNLKPPRRTGRLPEKKRQTMCEHRMPAGAFCRRCDS